MSALSRLLRAGVMTRQIFRAVDLRNGETAAETEFPQEARVNITVDHLDPAVAPVDQFGLRRDREQAQAALAELESRLAECGWAPTGRTASDHWYAREYARPRIDRDSAIVTRSAPAHEPRASLDE